MIPKNNQYILKELFEDDNFMKNFKDDKNRLSTYVNSNYEELPKKDYCTIFYGDECNFLKKLKKKWDRKNLFDSIRPLFTMDCFGCLCTDHTDVVK